METIDITREYYAQATPGVGFITIDDDYHIGDHQAEVRAALFLHNAFGGDIKLLKEETSVTGIKMPDYEWRGKLWELKNPTHEKAAGRAVRTAMKQIIGNGGGIILNFENREISFDILKKVLQDRFDISMAVCLDIMIIQKNQATIFQYKK